MERHRPFPLHHREASRLRYFRLIAVLLIAAPWLFLFGPVLAKNECFTLRDAGYYYYPMYQWNASQWQQGNVPLWNPLENIGTPVVDDATAAVFYPGQIVFHVPGLSFPAKFVLYVAMHVLIAAFGACVFCRRLGASPIASVLGGIAFAFGGSVLFQHCNVIFLVGAAWLPWAMTFGFRAISNASFRSAIACSLCLAMMVLGGDPQAAYHSMLALAVLVPVVRRMAAKNARQENNDSTPEPEKTESTLTNPTRLSKQLSLLALIAIVAIMLSAIQILPSAQWSSGSQRKTYVVPRTIYEVPGYLERESNVGWHGVNWGLAGSPLPGTHHHHIYQFSNPPWVIAELFFPNVSGTINSKNRRWSHNLPGVDRMWTPSIYMGLLPAILAVSFFSLRSDHPGIRWVSWLALLFAVASLGWYGLGWIVHEIAYGIFGVTPDKIPVGAGTGGLYWLMVKLLPGYVYFRYPAKLFVVASLGIAALAALGFDRFTQKRNLRLRVIEYLLPISCVIGIVSFFAGASRFRNWFDSMRPDFLYGPVDAGGAISDLRWAFLQTLVVALLLIGIRVAREKTTWISDKIFPLLLVFITMLELVVANHAMIQTGSANLWSDSNLTASMIHQQSNPTAAVIPPRIFRGQVWLPERWHKESSEQRLEESIHFNRETLFPKHQLQEEIGVVESFTSIAPYDHWAFMTVARTGGFVRADGLVEPNQEMLELLSTEFLILPENTPTPRSLSNDQDFLLQNTAAPLPRCWLTTNLRVLPQLKSNDPDHVGLRTRQVLIEDGEVRDLRSVSVIETDDQLSFEGTESIPTTCVEIIEYAPTRVIIRAENHSQAVLVLNDYYYPGWKAKVTTDDADPIPATVHRTNRIMRGIILPPGNHEVTFEYKPKSVGTGFTISLASLVIVGLLLAIGAIRNRSGRTLGNGAGAE